MRGDGDPDGSCTEVVTGALVLVGGASAVVVTVVCDGAVGVCVVCVGACVVGVCSSVVMCCRGRCVVGGSDGGGAVAMCVGAWVV